MVWVIGIIKFIFAAVAVFSTFSFIMLCINSAANPQLGTDKDGNIIEKNDNARAMFLIILSIAWGIVIAL